MLRLSVLALALVTTAAYAQPTSIARVLDNDPWCEEVYRQARSNQAITCEVREAVVQTDALDVNAHVNGAVKIKRWDRNDVLVRSRVSSSARGQSVADQLVDATAVETQNGVIRTRTPEARNAQVTVSFEIFAPRDTDVRVEVMNGPLSVHGLAGTISAVAMNGPVSLADVAGTIEVVATNGPVSVELSESWRRGAGLDIRATNGPISMTVPEGFSADLTARTTNGRITTSGLELDRLRRQRGRWTGDSLEGTLGQGGPPVSLIATNGPVRVCVSG